MSDNQVGIIDIGSNTIRLCLYKNTKDILETYYTKKDFFGLQKYIYNNVPSNKFCNADEIYKMCDLIVSNKTNFVGSNIVIDGGQIL